MEREVSQDKSKAIEHALRKSENLITQKTYDKLVTDLAKALARHEQAIRDRVPFDESGRDNSAAMQSDRDINVAKSEVLKLDGILKRAKLISPRQQTDVVRIGNTVAVLLVEEDIKVELHMVGKYDTFEGAMHLDTPLADAIYGMKKDDSVQYMVGDARSKRALHARIVEIMPGKFDPPRDPAQRKSS